MEQKILEATKYFKCEKGYIRLFEEIRKKYQTYEGNCPGNVILEKPTDIEKQAISRLMKKDYIASKKISINLAKLQDRINETRYSDVLLKDIVEKYFDSKIITNIENRKNENTKFDTFVNEIIKDIKNFKKEFKITVNKQKYWIKMIYNKNKEEAQKILKENVNLINNLPEVKTRIPVFASRIIKNPHGLDKGTNTEKLFKQILINILEEKNIDSIESNAEIYYTFNLLIDDVSNMVLCKNILGVYNNKIHEGYKGFYENNEAMQITLDNLYKLDKLEVLNNCALVVENPAVFMAISQKIKTKIPLICTSGQIKLSGLVLIKMIAKECKTIYYSGDIDPEGIGIASNLKNKIGNQIKFIGFDVNTYLKNITNTEVSKTRLEKLNGVLPEFKDIVVSLKTHKKVAFEEENIEFLIDFVNGLE